MLTHLLLFLLFLLPILLFLFLFLLIFLLVLLILSRLSRSLYNSRSDPIQITLSILADPTTTIIGLLKDADLLERLADLALHGRGAGGVV